MRRWYEVFLAQLAKQPGHPNAKKNAVTSANETVYPNTTNKHDRRRRLLRDLRRIIEYISCTAERCAREVEKSKPEIQLRLVGNAGAHFDPMTEVSQEDATQLLAFLRELLKYLYELPAALQKRRTPNP